MCALSRVLLLTLWTVDAANRRNTFHGNRLLQLNDDEDFKPLDCNPDSFDDVTCSSWKDTFGSTVKYNDLKIIPCNQCIRMDIEGGELVLNGGLDIQGKLLFEAGYKLILNTTHIVVQGELEIVATRAVTNYHDVEFILFGKNTKLEFNPLPPNSHLNGIVGKKSITVAGGKINIHGLPDNTPSWVKLFDIVNENENDGKGPTPNREDTDKLTFMPPPTGCDETTIVSENFAGGVAEHPWFGSLGAQYDITSDHGLRVYDRKGAYHGPQIDLKDITSACLVPDRIYLLTARVAYGGNLSTKGQLTDCANKHNNCLTIKYEYMTPDGMIKSSRKADERKSYVARYGEEFILAVEIKFTETEINKDNIYGTFRISGVHKDADVELKEFGLSLPPQDAYPSPESGLCSNLVPANGKADAVGLSPFPFKTSSTNTNVVVARDDTESYFQVTGKSESDKSGLAWSVPASCVEKSAKYSLNARVRVNSGSGMDGKLRFLMSADNPDGMKEIRNTLMDCPVSENSGWVNCTGIFSIPPEMDTGNELEYKISVQRLDANGESYPSVPYDISELDFALEGGAPIGIIVDNAVKGKWGIGAEILLTSYTNNHSDAQVRSIIEINNIRGDDQHVALILHDSFQKPTVQRNNLHPQTAVEVALLSRTIQFSGKFDEDEGVLHGCHLWVKHTPTVRQTLEGVGFVNCGQQGLLGRYPIHFHMSKSVSGSIVSKNLVRNSNQRGIVVHGTDYLNVSENVLYNTKGHGFLLEDGIEQFNKFTRNLAASTRKVKTLISDDESDDSPSSYWITNPTNYYEGNVAAGADGSGFWFELLARGSRVKSKVFNSSGRHPRTEPLLLFSDNIAHSNTNTGLRTYPHRGYSPDETAEFLRFSSFRNSRDGIFINISRNLNFVDSFLADNLKGIRVQHSDEIMLKDSDIIGVTSDFRELMRTQNIDPPCHRENIMAMHLETASRRKTGRSLTIQNVRVSGFDNTGCDESYVARLQQNRVEDIPSSFDAYTLFEGTRYDGLVRPAKIDFCSVDGIVSDAYITDRDSGLGPASASGTSTFISDSPTMTTFVQTVNCEKTPLCSLYCQKTCFHTITYFIPYPFDTEKYKLRVCNTDLECVEFSGVFENMPDLEATQDFRTRHFNAHLPTGEYDAIFVDDTGSETWPTSVHIEEKEKLCTTDLTVNLKSLATDCQHLIRNGNTNEGTKFWTHRDGDVINVVDSTFTSKSTNFGDAYVQWFDSRCVKNMQGHKYEITARVRMENKGVDWLCNPNTSSCPEIEIRTFGPSQKWEHAAKMVTEYGATEGDYQLIYGVFEIRPEMLTARRAEFHIKRNVADKSMFVKDIVMRLLPKSPKNVCNENLVLNGDFETKDSREWDALDIIKEGANFAGSFKAGNDQLAMTYLLTGCMDEGERYFVKAKFKLVDNNGNGIVCDNVKYKGVDCPQLGLKSYKDQGSEMVTKMVAKVVGTQVTDDWNEMYGEFDVSPNDANGVYHRFYIANTLKGYTYVVDDFEVQKRVDDSCSELILNGSLDIGFAGVFGSLGKSTLSNVQDDGNPGAAVQVSGRKKHKDGIKYTGPLDFKCFSPGCTFEVSADLKMVNTNGDGAPCDIMQHKGKKIDACPAIRIELKDTSNKMLLRKSLRGYAAQWSPDIFNDFVATFTVPKIDMNQNPWNGTIKQMNVFVRDYKYDYTLILDNLSIKRLHCDKSVLL